MSETKREKVLPYILIIVCFLIYFFAQISKHAISATANLFIQDYGVTNTEVGFATSAFLFCYGGGQIINGMLCRKYNTNLMVSIGLFLSCTCATLMYFNLPFIWYIILSGINGLAQSFFWVLLLYKLSSTLDFKFMALSTIFMSLASTGGSLFSSALSALFVKNNNYKGVFLTAGILLMFSLAMWIALNVLIPNSKKDEALEQTNVKKDVENTGSNKSFIFLIVIFALLSALTFGLSDSIKKWTPAFVTQFYGIADWISILISLVLPAIALFTSFINTKIYKKIKDFNLIIIIFSSIIAILFIPLIIFLKKSVISTVILFSLISWCAGFIINVTTTQVPLYLARGKINAGLLGGVLNGTAYLGSALVVVLVGNVAENYSWVAVFPMLLGIILLCLFIAVVYQIVRSIARKREN